MHTIVNPTPFHAALDVLPDRAGVATLHVALKATFRVGPRLEVADVQVPIRAIDEYEGDPTASALRYPGERHLACPGTAVIVIGSAHAPKLRAVPTLDVALELADVRKTVRVHGDRRWQRGASQASAAEPFTTMPLVYSRASGGPDDPRNPVGVGRREGRDLAGAPLPNLEDPRRPYVEHGERAPPMCLAALAPHWSPRQQLAGTYDTAWRRKRAPYLPDDLDPRFFHAAPPDQICARPLVGGEVLALTHASPEPLRFALPTLAWALHATIAGADHPLAPRLETVLLEPDAQRMTMLWRATLAVDRRELEIDAVTVDLREYRT